MGTFGGIRIPDTYASGLRSMGISDAAPIQYSAMSLISAGRDVLVHAETGSGKTLAFLIPALSGLDAARTWQVAIVTPTTSLAMQVSSIVSRLGHDPGDVLLLDSAATDSESVLSQARQAMSRRVVVGTTAAYKIITEDVLLKRACAGFRLVVVDEVDVVLNAVARGRGPGMDRRARRNRLLASCPDAGTLRTLTRAPQARSAGLLREAQLVCSSATVSKALLRDLRYVLGRGPHGPLQVAGVGVGPGREAGQGAGKNDAEAAHRRGVGAVGLPASLHHKFVTCTRFEDKVGAVARMSRLLLGNGGGQEHVGMGAPSVLVVGRSAEQCARMGDQLLRHHGIVARPVAEGLESAQGDGIAILIGTPMDVRGLDLVHVFAVILVCAPRDADEYAHVAGRAGRAGRPGFVVSLLTEAEHAQCSGGLSRAFHISLRTVPAHAAVAALKTAAPRPRGHGAVPQGARPSSP